MRKEVVVFGILFALLAFSASAQFVGTIEGYVRYLNGTLAGSSANINVSVASCSGSGCSGSTSTDANSYYVLANLNLQSGSSLTATAGKNLHRGSNTTTANAFKAASANITICQAPSAPTQTAAVDNHDTNRTLSWTSGTDPNGFDTYDVFQFASNASITNATSPQAVSGLSLGNSYSWTVQTCNTFNGNGCCSSTSSDTFSVTNAAPSAPTLVDEPNTGSTTASLEWTSGTDADGDPTRDEIQFSDRSDFSNVISSSTNTTSPYSVASLENTTTYWWRVRTCDAFGACSSYASDNFTMYTCTTSVVVSSGGGGGGGGGGSTCGGFNECQWGDVGCRGNARMVCGNFDGDAFLEFNIIPCPAWQKCVNGACVERCTENWQCESWGPCSLAGVQTRTCEDVHLCGTDDYMPATQRGCVPGVGEAPVLLGVPPFTIATPTILTTPMIPIGTGVLGFILGLLTLSLLFDKQFDALQLGLQLRTMSQMLKRGDFAKADVYNTRVVEPHIRSAVLDERKPAHRTILRVYYELNRDLARYHEKLALKVGEKAKASAFAKRADEFAKLIEKYA